MVLFPSTWPVRCHTKSASALLNHDRMKALCPVTFLMPHPANHLQRCIETLGQAPPGLGRPDKTEKKSKTGQQIVSRAKKKPTQKITRNNVAKTSSSWLSPAKISATTWVLAPKRTKLRDHNTGFLQKQIYGTNYASRTVWSMRFVLWIYNQVQDMFQFSYLTHRISEMSSDRRWRCWWAVGNLALSLHRTWPPDECLFPWIPIFLKVVVWCSDTLLFQGYQP